MDEGTLVVFHLPYGSAPALHRTFRRRVYGEESSSWGGKYRYHRKGILEEIPHVRLYWGVVIIRSQDQAGLTRWLRKEGAKVMVRRLWLTPSDRRSLQVGIDLGDPVPKFAFKPQSRCGK